MPKIHANVKRDEQYTLEQQLYVILEAYKDVHYKNAQTAIKNIKDLCRKGNIHE